MDTFSVNLQDLDNGPRDLDEAISDEWLTKVLGETEVTAAGNGPGHLEITLTKNDNDVLVQGRLDVTVSVPCSRTLDPAVYHLKPEIFLMLAPASGGDSSRGQRRARRAGSARRASSDAKVAEKSTKKAGGKKGGAWDADPELSEEEAAEDTYSGDQVLLDRFLREFILLEIPMVPLREDLRGEGNEANPALPADMGAGQKGQVSTSADSSTAPDEQDERPLDPRLSPLAELKARLENKK